MPTGMAITIIAMVLLLWLVLGGIIAILVCLLLNQKDSTISPSLANYKNCEESAVGSVTQT